MTPSMTLGFSLPVAEIREDVRRYAELGLTELFLEANVALHGWPVERTLEAMAALAPDRCLPAG